MVTFTDGRIASFSAAFLYANIDSVGEIFEQNESGLDEYPVLPMPGLPHPVHPETAQTVATLLKMNPVPKEF